MPVQQVTTDHAANTQGPLDTSQDPQLLLFELGPSNYLTPPAQHFAPAPKRAAELNSWVPEGQVQALPLKSDEQQEWSRIIASLIQKCRLLPAEYIRTKLPELKHLNALASACTGYNSSRAVITARGRSGLSSSSELLQQQVRLSTGGLSGCSSWAGASGEANLEGWRGCNLLNKEECWSQVADTVHTACQMPCQSVWRNQTTALARAVGSCRRSHIVSKPYVT